MNAFRVVGFNSGEISGFFVKIVVFNYILTRLQSIFEIYLKVLFKDLSPNFMLAYVVHLRALLRDFN